MGKISTFDCRLLGPGDAAAYEEAVKSCYGDDKGLTGENAQRELAYRMDIFGYDDLKHFVLYDGEKPIGISVISIDNDQEFTLQNIHLLSGYRGRGLGEPLYQTPMEHVRNHFGEGTVTAMVHFENAASIRLVQKQGFTAGKTEDNYVTFQRPLSGGPV